MKIYSISEFTNYQSNLQYICTEFQPLKIMWGKYLFLLSEENRNTQHSDFSN